MQICPDPLEKIHSIGSDQQWCVKLPACYPTIFPYIPNNVEYNDDKALNTGTINIDGNTNDCTSIIDTSLCANSLLIQRLWHKLDLYQTSSSSHNNTRQSHRYLTNIVKQHASNGDRQDRTNRNSTFSKEINHQTVDSKNDSNDRASSVMSIPVPSISRTPHISKQQVATNEQLRQPIHNLMTSTSHSSDRHFIHDHIISATDMKSSSSLSPSHNQQRVDSILSSKQSTSTIESPTSYSSDSEKQELLTPSSSTSTQTKKISNKHLQTTSFHDSSPNNISHMYINNRKRFDCLDHLHMKDAMAALEFDLTEEACQALINKKNDSQQNRFMRLLKASSRCCRLCRTQRRLATIAQRSIDIAIKNYTNTYH